MAPPGNLTITETAGGMVNWILADFMPRVAPIIGAVMAVIEVIMR